MLNSFYKIKDFFSNSNRQNKKTCKKARFLSQKYVIGQKLLDIYARKALHSPTPLLSQRDCKVVYKK